MKKFIYSFLILTIILIPSTCFAGKGFSEAEFEKLIECLGYGKIDLDEFTYLNNATKSGFVNRLSRLDFYDLIIGKWGSNKNTPGDNKVLVSTVQYNQSPYFDGQNSVYLPLIQVWNTSNNYLFDFENKTITYIGSPTSDYENMIPYWAFYSNNTVTKEEMQSSAYQERLIKENYLLYCEKTIKAIDGTIIFEPQKGAIIQSSYNGTAYTGSLIYGNSTETATITYTSGFNSSTEYDLFLEQYRLDNDADYGVGYYPIDTIELTKVTTADISVKIDISKFMDSSYYAYKLCLGKNTFEEKGENEVYLSTNWLMVNDNTLRAFPYFTQSHYMQLLSLVNYDINYTDPLPGTPGGGSSGDVIDSILGGLEPYFYNNLEGYYDLLTTDKLYLKIHDNNFDLIDINNYFLKLDIGKISGDETIHTGSVIIDSGDLWLPGNYAFPVYTINLQDYFEFQNYDYFYQVSLFDYDNNLIDRTNVFWFDETLFIETNIFEDIWNLLRKTFNAIVSLPSLILDGIMKIFVPEEGFLLEHFNTVNLWLDEHLGMLYFPFEFMIEFFNRIYSAEFGEPIIVIPAMQIPLFEEYGNIYDGATFNFNDFISQSEEFQNIYNLYLICADGIIIWGLARLLLRKYEEMMTDGNANHN